MARRQLASVLNDVEQFEQLHEGVPRWMLSSLMLWFESVLVRRRNKVVVGYREDLIRQAERRLHLAIVHGSERDAYNDLVFKVSSNGELALDVAETLLRIMSEDESSRYNLVWIVTLATDLETILYESGSKWKMVITDPPTGDDYQLSVLDPRLEERVDQTLEMQAQRLSEQGKTYSRYLASAWSNCYGRDPDPGKAYGDAIKAVEAASWPVIMPNDSTATIGKIAGELKANKNKWVSQLPFSTANKDDVGIDIAISMMLQLLENHSDRHATGNHKEILKEQAEQAVASAIYLCNLFGNELITAKVKIA